MLMERFKEYIEEVTASVNGLKRNILRNLAFLIPALMSVTSIIAFIVGIIAFAIRGGFAEQVDFVKAEGIADFESLFTSGTVSYVTQGVAAYILLALMTVEFVILTILYFIKESKVKKVILSICLVLMASPLFAIGGMFGGVVRNTNGLMVSVILAMVAVALYVIMMLKGCCDWLFLHYLKAIGFSWIAVPLLLFFLENIIPLLILLLMFGILVMGIMFVRKSNGSSISGEGVEKRTSKSEKQTSNTIKKDTVECVKRWDIERDAQLWVEENASGAKVVRAYGQGPMSKEYKEKITYKYPEEVMLCTFRKGDIVITIKGKIMTEKDLHYRNKG